MKLKDLKKGEPFTLKSIDNPHSSIVYIKGTYNRHAKKYKCVNFEDNSKTKMLDPNKYVYQDFVDFDD